MRAERDDLSQKYRVEGEKVLRLEAELSKALITQAEVVQQLEGLVDGAAGKSVRLQKEEEALNAEIVELKDENTLLRGRVDVVYKKVYCSLLIRFRHFYSVFVFGFIIFKKENL